MTDVNEIVLDGRYQIIQQTKGSISGGRVELGQRGTCRYCGTTDPKLFCMIAHTFPAAVGNRWVTSLDECDVCNNTFSKYEDALVKVVGPFLTLGGTRGRDNKIRQTGRSDGPIRLRRHEDKGGARLSFVSSDLDNMQISIDPQARVISLPIPIPHDPFVPRFAYKALVKMGLALLPDDELPNYGLLRAWLLDVNDTEDFPFLEVAMSFGAVGNAPPLVSGTLLRRVNPSDIVPHILFIFCAGSICLQIHLISDHLEDHIPAMPPERIKIRHTNVITDDKGEGEIRIYYGVPTHRNWASADSEASPIKNIMLYFNTQTTEGRLVPTFQTDM